MVEIRIRKGRMRFMKNSDTSPEARQVVWESYRRMSPARKFELICQAYRFGQTLAMAGIRLCCPDASDEQVWRIWAKRHLGEDLYEKVYGKDDYE